MNFKNPHAIARLKRLGNARADALREALGDIETVFRGRWLDEQGPPIHKAITTINEALK